MEHEGAHGAAADVLAALLVLDSQVEPYEDLPLTVVELTIRVLMGVIPSCWANSSCTAEANESLPAGETAAPGFED